VRSEVDDIESARREQSAWRRWGPYLSERAWGTVREDYSADGDAWTFFPHDHARSRAYRWSEDGLGGVCDERQLLCLAFAFWNGRDPDPQRARRLARERGAELSAVHAVPEPIYTSRRTTGARLVNDPWSVQAEIDEAVEEARSQMAHLGDVEPHTTSGDATEELARYGASVDLLIHRLAQVQTA
jgi:hypothetical protein